MHGNTAACVLLKLFIRGNERCHTTDPHHTTSAWAEFSNVNNIQSMIPEDQKHITTNKCSTGRYFTPAAQTQHTSWSKLNSTEKNKPSGSIACSPAWVNSSRGFIESDHQWLWKMPHHWRRIAHEWNSFTLRTRKI